MDGDNTHVELVFDLLDGASDEPACGGDVQFVECVVQPVDFLQVLQGAVGGGTCALHVRQDVPSGQHEVDDAGGDQCQADGRDGEQIERRHFLQAFRHQRLIGGPDQVVQQDQGA